MKVGNIVENTHRASHWQISYGFQPITLYFCSPAAFPLTVVRSPLIMGSFSIKQWWIMCFKMNVTLLNLRIGCRISLIKRPLHCKTLCLLPNHWSSYEQQELSLTQVTNNIHVKTLYHLPNAIYETYVDLAAWCQNAANGLLVRCLNLKQMVRCWILSKTLLHIVLLCHNINRTVTHCSGPASISDSLLLHKCAMAKWKKP